MLQHSPALLCQAHHDYPAAVACMRAQVLMLCWDDQTNNLGLHSGLMGTHDEATFAFFKGTKVTCLKCPRQGGSEDSYLQVPG